LTLKALMVDVDGVIVRHPRQGRRWDERLEADLGIKPDDLQQRFFAPYFRDIVLGRAALEDRLALVLPALAPHVSPQQLMTYWFEQDAHLDPVLLDLADRRAGGLQLHLATVQEHRRAAYLWDDLGLKHQFDGLHHSAAVGAKKPDLAYFRAVETRTGFAPHEVLLIDDSPANVEAARAAGWGGVLWTGEARLAELLP
jgi:putative hydrolase of the HAD superfamily